MLKELKSLREAFEDRVLDSSLIADIESCTKGVIPYRILDPGDSLALMSGFLPEDELPTVGEALFPYQVEYLTTEQLDPVTWDALRLHLLTYVSAMLDVMRLGKDGTLPDIRQVVIQERGEKVRMVTPVTGSVSYISMFLNRVLLSTLDQDPRLTTRESMPMDGFVRKTLNRVDGYVLRSVDMTRATDLMPLDLVSALVEGIIQEWGLPPALGKAFRYCSGPMSLWVDGVVSVRTCRAILMGLGTTWPLLSLYNLWLYEDAWTSSGLRNHVSRAARGVVRIVGDDLLGYIPRSVSDRYTSGLIRTGGKPSFGKDLCSESAGVLVEQMVIIVAPVTPPRKPFQVLPTCSIRPLLPGLQSSGGQPVPLWAMGKQLSECIKQSMHSTDLTWLVAKMYWREIQRLKKTGIPPFLPRLVGGAEFPGSPRDVRRDWRMLKPRWLRALRCAMATPGGEGLLSKLSSPWSTAPSNPLSERMRSFWEDKAVGAVSELTPDECPEVEFDLTAADCVERALSQASNAQRMLSAVPPTVSTTGISVLSRKLEHSVKTLNGLVPEHKFRDKVINMSLGLRRWLAKASRGVSETSLIRMALVTGVTLGKQYASEVPADVEDDWA